MIRAIFQRDTIFARLILLILATAGPLLVLLGVVELVDHLHESRTAAVNSSLRTAQSIASHLEDERNEASALLQTLVLRPSIVPPAGAPCDPAFSTFAILRPEFANLAAIDANGTLRCSARPASAVSYAQIAWFRRAQSAADGFVTGPVMSPMLREWVVAHVQPLRASDGTFGGALFIVVRASRYAALLRSFEFASSSVSMIHDRSGTIIAHSGDPKRWTGRTGRDFAIVQRALAGHVGTLSGSGADKVTRLYGVVPLPSNGWWVEIGIPRATILAPIRHWILGHVPVVLIFIALATILAISVARSIVRPMRTLARRAQQLSVDHKSELGEIEGPLEIQQLGSSFEKLLVQRAEAESDLASREQHFQTILDTTSDGIWASGPDGITTYVNPRMAEMLARPAEEIIGKPAVDMFGGELRSAMEARLARRKQGIAETYELRLRLRGDHVRWQIHSTPVLDSFGQYEGHVATINDVTREREAEERAREKEQQLETIFASAMDGIVIVDESQCIVMFNEAAEAMFGYSANEAIGMRVEELMPERFRATHAELVRRFGDNNVSRRAMGNLGSVFGLRRNGEEFPIEASISHVRAGGRLLYSVILRDVTARLENERALRESERRLSAVVALSGAGVWEGDTSTDELYCDERGAHILGFPPGTPMPVSFSAALAQIHPDEQERVIADFARLHSGEADQFDAEYHLVTRRGEAITIASLGRVLERLEGGHLRLVGAAFDITARKEAEARLSAEMDFNRTLIDASPAFFVAFSGDGTILSVNDAFLRSTGYTREEVVGREYIGMFIPPEARAEARNARAAINTFDETLAIDAPVLTRDGQKLIVEWHARPVLSAAGEVQFHFGVGIDITQRKEHETELRSHVGFLDALHETTLDLLRHRPLPETMEAIVRRAAELFHCPDAFLALRDSDNALRIIAAIGAGSVLVGEVIQPGESICGVVYQSGTPLVIDDYQTWPQARFADRLPSRAMASVPMKIDDSTVGALTMSYRAPEERFTGQQVEVLKRFARLAALVVDQARLLSNAKREIAERLKAEEEIRRLNATLEETVRARTSELRSQIAERVRIEAELRRRSEQLSNANLELAGGAKLKDEFLANMSHELRTPLNAILGMAEILEEGVHGSINERQLRSVRLIAESGQHLLDLINDILDLAKIESGTVDLSIEAVKVTTACESSLRMLREAAQRKRIHLGLDIPPDIDTIDADDRRLRQILVNLLSNAVKFTPEGGSVTLRVRGDASRNTMSFSVEDTGIGIPASQIERLFQPFVQLDGGSTRQYGGTGLGLSLVRRMAEMHHGHVEMQSIVGKGSTFTLVVPWRVSYVQPQASEWSAQAAGGGNGPVLVIEDDATAAQIISRYLSEAGLPAVVWDEREDLLPLIERVRPRLVVLDILLQTTTGWDVLAAIKATPSIASTPVLIISVVDDAARGLAMGAVDYLVKPIRHDQFHEALKRVVPELRQRIDRARPLILLAEDNEANIEVLENYLTGRGFEVLVARDGVAAVELALDRRPALIIMDIQMPKMNGLDATTRIREAQKSEKPTPILALTAMAMCGDIERCIAAGANECITKPVSLKVLDETIRRYLES